MKKPRFGGDGRSAREDAEREAQEELNRLTRRAGPPPSSGGDAPAPSVPPARSSYSQQRDAYTPTGGTGAGNRAAYTPPPRAAASARSYSPPPAESRSPGFGGRAPVAGENYDESEFDEEYEEDEDDIYQGPRNAKEEEEAVTGLALRDWAAHRGQPDRLEDFALPRLDRPSVEAQRDRALRDIMERQERMQKEYREQTARLQPVDGSAEVSDLRNAHQMNVLRRGKPPGMMNMAAAQTGSLNRQRRERMAVADELAASPPPAPAGAKAKGRAKKAPVAAPAARSVRASKAVASTATARSAPAPVAKTTRAAGRKTGPVARGTGAAGASTTPKPPGKGVARSPSTAKRPAGSTAPATTAGAKARTVAKAVKASPVKASPVKASPVKTTKAPPAKTAVRKGAAAAKDVPATKAAQPVRRAARPVAKPPRRG